MQHVHVFAGQRLGGLTFTILNQNSEFPFFDNRIFKCSAIEQATKIFRVPIKIARKGKCQDF